MVKKEMEGTLRVRREDAMSGEAPGYLDLRAFQGAMVPPCDKGGVDGTLASHLVVDKRIPHWFEPGQSPL
jgi:hypothetical protein